MKTIKRDKQSYSNVAVIVPCLNEEKTIRHVVKSFIKVLPGAEIIVCDNGSNDRTTDEAIKAGASVVYEPARGKGKAIQRAFREVDATFYIMVDGDMTYDPLIAPNLIRIVEQRCVDMLVCARTPVDLNKRRFGHHFGTWAYTALVNFIFGLKLNDLFSGYRVFSRAFVKSFPILSDGFEIETEMTIHAASLNLNVFEINADYIERPIGSVSKLKTLADGSRILIKIIRLIMDHKPGLLLHTIALFCLSTAFFIFWPVWEQFLETGLVPKLPTAILAMGLVLSSFFCFFSAIIMKSISLQRLEAKKMHFLKVKI